jgi:hypothetical protein
MSPRELDESRRGVCNRSTPDFLQGWTGCEREELTS